MADYTANIEAAQQQFAAVLEQQLARVERLNAGQEPTDFAKLTPIMTA